MKRHLLAYALALLACAAPAPAAAPAQEPAPETGEALRALEKVLSNSASYAANGFVRRFEARNFKGCKIMYELSPQPAPGNISFVPFAERMTVDLASLDAARVQVVTGRRGASVTLAPRGDAPAIERQLGESPHSFGKPSLLTSAYIFLPNKQTADEVRATLLRAIESCAR